MPHIDGAVQNLPGAAVSAGTNFTSRYWQLPMHSDSNHLHSFMTTDVVIKPTHTTLVGCNSAATFQDCVEPCFQ